MCSKHCHLALMLLYSCALFVGGAHYVYPGATHTRFEHSIGWDSWVLLYIDTRDVIQMCRCTYSASVLSLSLFLDHTLSHVGFVILLVSLLGACSVSSQSWRSLTRMCSAFRLQDSAMTWVRLSDFSQAVQSRYICMMIEIVQAMVHFLTCLRKKLWRKLSQRKLWRNLNCLRNINGR